MNEMRIKRTDPNRRLTADEAQRILDRATALDSMRDGTVNVADLRAAAIEAGISADAFDQAASSPDSSTDDRRRRVAQRIAFFVIAMIAISLLVSQFMFRGSVGPAPSAPVPEASP